MIIADLVIIVNINNNIEKYINDKHIFALSIILLENNNLSNKTLILKFSIHIQFNCQKKRMDKVNPLKLCKKKCNAV